MKTSRITLLTLLFMIVGIAGTAAQGQRDSSATPEERASRMTDRLKTTLKLNDDQASKVQNATVQMIKDMAAARESGQDMRSSMQTIMTKYNADLQKIMTPEQYKTYQDNKRQLRQNRLNGSGSGNTSN